jgi:hypothetical protein
MVECNSVISGKSGSGVHFETERFFPFKYNFTQLGVNITFTRVVQHEMAAGVLRVLFCITFEKKYMKCIM